MRAGIFLFFGRFTYPFRPIVSPYPFPLFILCYFFDQSHRFITYTTQASQPAGRQQHDGHKGAKPGGAAEGSRQRLLRRLPRTRYALPFLLTVLSLCSYADLHSKGPRWASWNIGVFLCVRCAGVHRGLGAHISKIKSVNLDAWTPEQLMSIAEKGNEKANAFYLAKAPPGAGPANLTDSYADHICFCVY